jgi:hypothetical protein
MSATAKSSSHAPTLLVADVPCARNSRPLPSAFLYTDPVTVEDHRCSDNPNCTSAKTAAGRFVGPQAGPFRTCPARSQRQWRVSLRAK